jgi:hypothetical protein
MLRVIALVILVLSFAPVAAGPFAHMWSNLAAAGGNKDGAKIGIWSLQK